MACIERTNDLKYLFERVKITFDPIYDGHMHRFGHNNAGWYVGFKENNITILNAGNFIELDDDFITYISKLRKSDDDKRFIQRKMDALRIESAKKAIEHHKEAQARAKSLVDDHSVDPLKYGYLVEKGITELFGAISRKGILHIPMVDEDGVLWAHQRIIDADNKKFWGRLKGLRHVIGEPTNKVLLCEGFATGASLHMATKLQVIVCFNAGNMVEVCKTLKKQEGVQYIVCADNDCWPKPDRDPAKPHKNTGLEAANRTGLAVALPTFDDGKSKDFNDLYLQKGAEAVCALVHSVNPLTDPFSNILCISDISDEKYQSYVTRFEMVREVRASRKDFLTGQVVYWSKKDKRFESIWNVMESIRSVCDGASLDRTRVSDNLHRYCNSLPPRWLFEVPEWDGKDRIGWMCSFVTPSKVSQSVFENFIKAWFANIFMRVEDNCFHNFLPILQSNLQGMGKSHWNRVITSGFGYYYGRAGDTGDEKNILMTASSKLVIDFDEFDKFYRLHPGFVKNLISTNEENYRAPYERAPRDYQMRASFIGSCNRDDFLRDTTGNRRFVVFALDAIDHGYGDSLPHEDKLQIVAQAKALYLEGYKVTEENKTLMAKIIERLTPDDPNDSALEEWEAMVNEAIALDGPNANKYITSPQASQIWEVICRRNGIRLRDFQSLLKRTGRSHRTTRGTDYYPRAKP